MTQNVSDIVALARTVGMKGFASDKGDQPASEGANVGKSGAGESHYALAVRRGLPGFGEAAGGSR